VAETDPVGVGVGGSGDVVLAVAGDTAPPPSASAHDDVPPPPPSSTAELPSSPNANVETKFSAPAFSSTMTENVTPPALPMPGAATATATAPALATNTSGNAIAPSIATAIATATATAPTEKPPAIKKSKTATKSKKTKDPSTATEKEKPKKKVKKLKFSVDGPPTVTEIVGKNKDQPGEKATKKKNKVSDSPLYPLPSIHLIIFNNCSSHLLIVNARQHHSG
jgi:hypothetical protein